MKTILVVALLAVAGATGAYRTFTGQWPLFHQTALDDHAGHDHGEPRSANASPGGERRILFYRNPMGLPDTSPVPKKDSMGMDYVPVYADEAGADGTSVAIPLARLQRSGYRSEKVARRSLDAPIRAPVTIMADERRVKIVALRMESFIEKLFVDATGQPVREGQPLFRFVSQQLQQTEIDLIIGTRSSLSDGSQQAQGAIQRLRNLGMPESHIRDIVATRTLPRGHDWPSPASGTVIAKSVFEGQRAAPGDELYRIADLSTVWAIADVSEVDIGRLRVGDPASIGLRAFPVGVREGRIAFIYPDLRPETRTVRARIELANPDGTLRLGMYGEANLRPLAEAQPVLAVPADAVIDSGRRQAAIVALGEGRFEPREIKIGRRGGGFVEIADGLAEGEEVATAANFLIDAESNLKAALKAFADPASGVRP